MALAWESHPTWVRGLKYRRGVADVLTIMSHPTWVRGLKFGKLIL